MDTKVVTGKVRFSYVHVFKPKAVNEGDQEKYSVSILIPKRDKATIKKVEEAIKAAYEEGKAKHKLPSLKACKTPLRDGDEERPEDEAYEGMLFMNANSSNRPGVVDENRDEIIDKDEFYSGCWGRASVNFFAYSTRSKGIACGLNGVQKLDDGDRLSGSGFNVDDFATESDLL
jgi:hypothetical protein